MTWFITKLLGLAFGVWIGFYIGAGVFFVVGSASADGAILGMVAWPFIMLGTGLLVMAKI